MTQTAYWTSSRVLLRETVLRGELVNLSPLRIGAGGEPPLGSPVDLAVIRINMDGAKVPYIPGSSLKGTIRSQASAIAMRKGLEVCSGLSKSTCMENKRYVDTETGEQRLSDFIEKELRYGSPEKATEAFFKTACLMCRIFGAPSYASKVTFSDAYPVGNVRLGVRTGVAISRKTGAVAFGPYQVEYVEPGSRFTFSVTMRNLPNYALGLIAYVLKMMMDGEVAIGGFKTRGFGKITIENLIVMNREAGEPSLTLKSLEKDTDIELNISDYAKVEEDWAVSKGGDCLSLMDKLVEVWKNVNVAGSQK